MTTAVMLEALAHYDKLVIQLDGDKAAALAHTMQRFGVDRDDFRRAVLARDISERVEGRYRARD